MRKVLAGAVCWVLLLWAPSLAFAAGPPVYLGDLGAVLLLPNQAIVVEIEQVKVNLPSHFRGDEVLVTYRLLNTGPAVRNEDLFIIARGWRWPANGSTTSSMAREITAELQGTPLPSIWPRVDPLGGDDQWEKPKYYDPLTGDPHPDILWREVSLHTQATRFLFDLDEGEAAELVLTYRSRPTYQRRRHGEVRHYNLPLRGPGTNWAESNVTVLVESERGAGYWIAADGPVTRRGPNYEIHVSDPGAQALSFSIMSRAGTLFGWVTPRPYYYLLAAGLVVLNAVFFALRRAWGTRRLSLAGRIASGLFMVMANLVFGIWVLTMRPVISFFVTSPLPFSMVIIAVAAVGFVLFTAFRIPMQR